MEPAFAVLISICVGLVLCLYFFILDKIFKRFDGRSREENRLEKEISNLRSQQRIIKLKAQKQELEKELGIK